MKYLFLFLTSISCATYCMEKKDDGTVTHTLNTDNETFLQKLRRAVTPKKPVTYQRINIAVYSHELINPEGKFVCIVASDKNSVGYPPEALNENGNLKTGWKVRTSLLE